MSFALELQNSLALKFFLFYNVDTWYLDVQVFNNKTIKSCQITFIQAKIDESIVLAIHLIDIKKGNTSSLTNILKLEFFMYM